MRAEGISPTDLCYPWHCFGRVYPILDDFIPGCGPVAAGVIFCEFLECLYSESYIIIGLLVRKLELSFSIDQSDQIK